MAERPPRKEIEAKIIERAWKDQRFKLLLLKNPRAAFKELGIDLPENIEIRIIEEKPNTVTMVLPALPKGVQELSAAELEKLAGGTGENSKGCPTQRTCWPGRC